MQLVTNLLPCHAHLTLNLLNLAHVLNQSLRFLLEILLGFLEPALQNARKVAWEGLLVLEVRSLVLNIILL